MKIHRGVLSALCVATGLVTGLVIASAYLKMQGASAMADVLCHLAIWPGAAGMILFSFLPCCVEAEGGCRTDSVKESLERDIPAKTQHNFARAADCSMVEKV